MTNKEILDLSRNFMFDTADLVFKGVRDVNGRKRMDPKTFMSLEITLETFVSNMTGPGDEK